MSLLGRGARRGVQLPNLKLKVELIQSHMAQEPKLRGEVGARALRVRSVTREGHGRARSKFRFGTPLYIHANGKPIFKTPNKKGTARPYQLYCLCLEGMLLLALSTVEVLECRQWFEARAEVRSVPVVTPLARMLLHSTRLGRGQRCGMHRLGPSGFGVVEENEVRGCSRMN